MITLLCTWRIYALSECLLLIFIYLLINQKRDTDQYTLRNDTVLLTITFFKNTNISGECGVQSYNGFWGGAPSGVQLQSPWSRGQEDKPLPWTWRHFCLSSVQMKHKFVHFCYPANCSVLTYTFWKNIVAFLFGAILLVVRPWQKVGGLRRLTMDTPKTCQWKSGKLLETYVAQDPPTP